MHAVAHLEAYVCLDVGANVRRIPVIILIVLVIVVDAADGRTLGLFSSRRAAQEAVRARRQAALDRLPVGD